MTSPNGVSAPARLGLLRPPADAIMPAMNFEELRADLERVVGDRPLAEGETLVDALARLDGAAASGDCSGRLKHYLSRRSYRKALEWLDAPPEPHASP